MIRKQVDRSTLDAWVARLIEDNRIIGVQAKGDRFVFDDLARAEDLRLDYDVTILPPKKLFQPQNETILTYADGKYDSVTDDSEFVLLGVHPYDLVAINQMDKLFQDGNYDVHYMSRRKNATIVACDIQAASQNVFAGCMGTATVSEGYDVLLSRVGDYYVIESATEKGDALTASLADAEDADQVRLARREQLWEDNRKYLQRHELAMDKEELPDLLGRSVDHAVWEEKAEHCFSCGSCNLVCPTCYCFDVQDDVKWDLKSACRTRCWDGCMLTNFAMVAGNHNFRKDRAERYRHRYYRKGKYVPEKIGEISCVGCGRCISACVSKIANPVEVYNRLLEVH